MTLSGVKSRSNFLLRVEHAFFFLNMALFLLNTSTLALQLFCMFHTSTWYLSPADGPFCMQVFPRQSLRLIKDPAKGIFVPLVVLSFATILIGTINYGMHESSPPPAGQC